MLLPFTGPSTKRHDHFKFLHTVRDIIGWSLLFTIVVLTNEFNNLDEEIDDNEKNHAGIVSSASRIFLNHPKSLISIPAIIGIALAIWQHSITPLYYGLVATIALLLLPFVYFIIGFAYAAAKNAWFPISDEEYDKMVAETEERSKKEKTRKNGFLSY